MTLTELLAHINELNDEFTIYCAGWLAHPCAASRRAERAPLCSACLTRACEGRSTRCSAPPAATYDQANALPDEPGGQHRPPQPIEILPGDPVLEGGGEWESSCFLELFMQMTDRV